jgi:hypothetical protein
MNLKEVGFKGVDRIEFIWLHILSDFSIIFLSFEAAKLTEQRQIYQESINSSLFRRITGTLSYFS